MTQTALDRNDLLRASEALSTEELAELLDPGEPDCSDDEA